MASEPISFRRYFGDGRADDRFQPIDLAGCRALQHVWTGRLKRGEYTAIDLTLASGQVVRIRAAQG